MKTPRTRTLTPVMNGGIMPSGYYDDYNELRLGTISISEGGNSCGYVQYNKSKFPLEWWTLLHLTYQTNR